jgi:hypothetical protein
MTATLSDRYVWAVLRAVPGAQRAELEPEVRALVADAIEARSARGDLPPAEVERAALVELGDPSVLAAQYTTGPKYLIGPLVYPHWWRILTTVVLVVTPIVGFVVLGSSLLSGSTVGEAIVSGGAAGVQAAFQIAFWVTLVMAVIERFAGPDIAAEPWTPDSLPEVPDEGRISPLEVGLTIAFSVVVIGVLLWVQLAPPIEVDGTSYPLFDPALWSFWLPYFIVREVVEIGFQVALLIRGRWTWTLAAGNAVLGAAFAIPAVWLLANEMLFNPALVDAVVAATGGGEWLRVTTIITALVIVGIIVFDAIDGFTKARRAESGTAGHDALRKDR